MLIDIHMIQNYAPSNLNRDDTGAPKDAVFGGCRRARISSQAIKRSIRRSEVFEQAFRDRGLLATRTRQLPSLLRPALGKFDLSEELVDLIVNRAQEIGRESGRKKAKTTDEGDPETAQLIFLSDQELADLAAKLAKLVQEHGAAAFKKMGVNELTKQLGSSIPRSVDVAMFGRMTTSAAFDDMHAAVQVAHPLSTHNVEQEFDYYTAVDDISGESGAGFIGDTAFNSATFYKYFSIHWEGLLENLGDDAIVARQATEALIAAAATVNPSGKQNSFAAHNLPDLVLVEVRERNLPISYANAFLKPIRANHNESLLDASVNALSNYMEKLNGVFAIPAERAWIATDEWSLPDATRLATLSGLIDWLPLNGPTA